MFIRRSEALYKTLTKQVTLIICVMANYLPENVRVKINEPKQQ